MGKIVLAKSAGFCFGVNRAVNIVNDLIEKNIKTCTLGPIIHNTEMVNELKAKGVSIVDEPSMAAKDATIVIRSHGVPLSVYKEIEHLKIKFTDATCPFVAKIHKTVKIASDNGKIVLIAGDATHPEVKGIQGHCTGKSYIFKSNQELEDLAVKHPNLTNSPICIVVQTTFNASEWKKCLKTAEKVYTNAVFFDTICSATSKRQTEAESLAKQSDVMLIIGDKNSSNTGKLYDICKNSCKNTFLVETGADIPADTAQNANQIGVTAGASTPARIIKEVLDKMSDIIKDDTSETTESELSFAEMLEENLEGYNNDGRVKGVVESITPNEVYVDVGRKQAGVVKLDELTNDPNAKIEDLVKVGDVLDLLIMRTNDQEGVITLSKKRVDALRGWDDIEEAADADQILTGMVTEVIKGGIIVVCKGVRVFIPASQATASRNEPLEELLRKEVQFKVIECERKRRRLVGSIRAILKEQRAKAKEEFWKTCEAGKIYKGIVKSLTSYGAFVDIGGVDGMIHISELSWNRIKHPSEIVSVGDTVEVYVKDVDTEKGNISLGYKKTEDNPWEILKSKYPVGSTVEATIVGMTAFGAFARVLPGIDGLIHISQIANRRIEKPQDELSVGQTVKAKITAIDFDKRRISLSIRELLEPVEEGQSVETTDEIVASTETPKEESAEKATEETVE